MAAEKWLCPDSHSSSGDIIPLTPYHGTGSILKMRGEKVMQRLTIGQVARQAGVKVETVKFYERQGLIEQPPRPASGYRTYPPQAAARIRFIRRAQELGFSLKEIGELLSLRFTPETSCAEVKARAEAKIATIERKREALRKMQEALQRLAAACKGEGPVSECPILEAMDEGEKDFRKEKSP
jgi:MerR family mercuric resistance operon transcriptional regulator